MAEKTGISWTDSTFNPWIGCTKVGPGCDNCYAEALMDKRWHRVQWGSGKPRERTSAGNWKLPERWNKQVFAECPECGWRGEQRNAICGCDCPSCMQPGVLVSARRRVFCASLADVFDNEAPPQWRGELWALVKATPHLDWLILTKRIGNVPGMAPADGLPPNVWLGATMVNQDEYDRDVHKLLAVPASVRFLSVEPMVGPITGGAQLSGLDWVIVGGESGHGARPIRREWIDSLRRECDADGVAFFFKQWGGASATAGGCRLDGAEVKQWPCAA